MEIVFNIMYVFVNREISRANQQGSGRSCSPQWVIDGCLLYEQLHMSGLACSGSRLQRDDVGEGGRSAPERDTRMHMWRSHTLSRTDS